MSPATMRVIRACFCAGVLSAVGCAGSPTSPSASIAGSSLATGASKIASLVSPRSGSLRVTKNCSSYAGQAGNFCTIVSSSLDAIDAGSTIVYAQAANLTTFTLDSDVVLNSPKPGNNLAFGRCQVDLVSGGGECAFSGGTGKFTHFQATVDVSQPDRGAPIYVWDGTYSFSPNDEPDRGDSEVD